MLYICTHARLLNDRDLRARAEFHYSSLAPSRPPLSFAKHSYTLRSLSLGLSGIKKTYTGREGGLGTRVGLLCGRFLAHANCTPFFSPKHLVFVTEKNSVFCHLENTVFQALPKNAFFISFAHFLVFLGGSNNHSLVENQRVHRSFSPKKNSVG